MLSRPALSFPPCPLRAIIGLMLIAATGAGSVFAAEPQEPGAPAEEPAPPKVEKVSEDLYRFGSITIDRKARSLSFPAQVNMDAALVEYFCVTQYGKIHEAVLVTEIVPEHLHTAVLLISKKGEIPPTPPAEASNTLPTGCPVTVTISWTTPEGEKRKVPAVRFLQNTETKKSPPENLWIYTSSRLYNGEFLADIHGDIIALMENIDAMININDEDRQNDELWEVHTEAVPAVGTPVMVTIALPSRPS